MTSGRATFSLSTTVGHYIYAAALPFSPIVIPQFVIPTLEESASRVSRTTAHPGDCFSCRNMLLLQATRRWDRSDGKSVLGFNQH